MTNAKAARDCTGPTNKRVDLPYADLDLTLFYFAYANRADPDQTPQKRGV